MRGCPCARSAIDCRPWCRPVERRGAGALRPVRFMASLADVPGNFLPLLHDGVQAAWRLASRAFRRHLLVPMLGAALSAALLALVLPFAAPADGPPRRDADVFADAAATLLANEDLAAFRANARWGVSLQEERRREQAEAERLAQQRARQEELEMSSGDAEQNQAAWSPELQAIGFVGVVIAASERVVLLTLPADKIGRFHVGDALEDGRRLASISAQALVLQREDGQEETLPLFPPAFAAADASIAHANSPPAQGK